MPRPLKVMGRLEGIWESNENIGYLNSKKLILAVLQGDQTVAQLTREQGVADSLIHKWRTQFLEADRARLFSNQQETVSEARH